MSTQTDSNPVFSLSETEEIMKTFRDGNYLKKRDLAGNLVSNICNSLEEMKESFNDIQVFLDEYPKSSRLGDLPKAPIWYELRNLMSAAGIFNPLISMPPKTFILMQNQAPTSRVTLYS